MEKIIYRLRVAGITIDCHTQESLLEWVRYALDHGKTIESITMEVIKNA